MLIQKSRSAGRPAAQTARRAAFRPADSRAKVLRRPPVPRPANDNHGLRRLLRLRRPMATAIVVAAALTAALALIY